MSELQTQKLTDELSVGQSVTQHPETADVFETLRIDFCCNGDRSLENDMAIRHAATGEVIDVRPLNQKIAETKTSNLLKTSDMEVLQLVMPAGKTIAEDKAPGKITVQCLEGRIVFTSDGNAQELVAGEMLYLDAAVPHVVEAVEDSSALVTILLSKRA